MNAGQGASTQRPTKLQCGNVGDKAIRSVECSQGPAGFGHGLDPLGSRRLMNAAHAPGIAVILDSVYEHTHPEFTYDLVQAGAWLPFPTAGAWVEMIDVKRPSIHITQNGQWSPAVVASNYGRIYRRT